MPGPIHTARGEVLRAWRVAAGWGRTELASKLYASRISVWQWEAGTQRLLPDTAEAVADLLNAGPALTGTVRAAASTLVYAPHVDWKHNFPPGAQPGWAWIRNPPEQATVVAALRWGDGLHGLYEVPRNSHGVFVQFPTTVANPPLEITLAQPGWVEFGTGTIPPAFAEHLQTIVVDAATLQVERPPTFKPLAEHGHDLYVATKLRPLLHETESFAASVGLRWSLIRPHLGAMWRTRTPLRALDRNELAASAYPGEIVYDGRGDLITQLLLSNEQMRLLRKVAGLSLADTEAQTTALLPGDPLSDNAIERLEKSASVPRARLALARLDTVYGADGRVGVDRVFDGFAHSRAHGSTGKHAEFSINLPEFWVGPVWVQARAPHPDSTGTMILRWGPWRSRQVLTSGSVVVTRKATRGSEPITAQLPAGWWVTAGTGAAPAAHDIGRDWRPVNLRAAWGLFAEGLSALRRAVSGSPALGLTPPEFEDDPDAETYDDTTDDLLEDAAADDDVADRPGPT